MSQILTRTLIVLRHAHRDTFRREDDNGLSDKGREQVRKLQGHFVKYAAAFQWKEAQFFSSPRLRCQETIGPLAEALNAPMEVHPLLEEQREDETQFTFVGRIEKFFHEWRGGSSLHTVICSHGDWIPVFFGIAL